MNKIFADQLIYTRIEEAYSSLRKRGYQVYYASSKLKQNDIDTVVSKINDFQPHVPEVHRWQCFFLGNGEKVVITHAQIIDSHPEIVDRDRRPNTPLTHCLIFDVRDYQKINYNPFWLIKNFQFVSSATEMVEEYNQSKERERVASFSVLDQYPFDGDLVWKKQALNFIYLSSPQFVEEKKKLLLYGDFENIYDAIESVYAYAPISYRRGLSFDTYIRSGVRKGGNFWAVGSSEMKPNFDVVINTSSKMINRDLGKTSNPYTKWLEHSLDKEGVETAIPIAHEIFDAISVKRKPRLNANARSICHSFIDVNQQFVLYELKNILSQKMRVELVALFEPFFIEKNPPCDTLSIIAVGNVAINPLSEVMKRWLSTNPERVRQLHKKDWASIKKIAVNARNIVLTLWATSRTKDKKMFLETASLLSSSDDVSLALQLLNNDARLSIIQLFLLRKDKQRLLDTTFVFVLKLDNRQLTRLEKTASKSIVPAGFQKVLNARRQELGKPRFWAGLKR